MWTGGCSSLDRSRQYALKQRGYRPRFVTQVTEYLTSISEKRVYSLFCLFITLKRDPSQTQGRYLLVQRKGSPKGYLAPSKSISGPLRDISSEFMKITLEIIRKTLIDRE
jgi:hypothetical protein